MGLPSDVRVHGWGLSLERPTMIRYGISNIRDLLGHKVRLLFFTFHLLILELGR
jgi:phenylalanyl-tRNA synthetase alpha chain